MACAVQLLAACMSTGIAAPRVVATVPAQGPRAGWRQATGTALPAPPVSAALLECKRQHSTSSTASRDLPQLLQGAVTCPAPAARPLISTSMARWCVAAKDTRAAPAAAAAVVAAQSPALPVDTCQVKIMQPSSPGPLPPAAHGRQWNRRLRLRQLWPITTAPTARQ